MEEAEALSCQTEAKKPKSFTECLSSCVKKMVAKYNKGFTAVLANKGFPTK